MTIESILLERIKFIGDGEFTLLGTPAELIEVLRQQVKGGADVSQMAPGNP